MIHLLADGREAIGDLALSLAGRRNARAFEKAPVALGAGFLHADVSTPGGELSAIRLRAAWQP